MRVSIRLADVTAAVHKDLRTALSAAWSQGWTFERSGTSHFMATSPQGLEVRFGRGANYNGDVDAIQRSLWKAGLSIPNTKYERKEMETPDTQMAEALKEAGVAEAIAKPQPKTDKLPPGGMEAMILEAFRGNPRHAMSYGDVVVVLKAKRPETSAGSVSAIMSNLKMKGKLLNPERGYWKLAPEHAVPPPPIANAPPIPLPPRLERKRAAGADVEVLNRLLHAMADAEGVIRRLIEKQEAIEKMREVLNK